MLEKLGEVIRKATNKIANAIFLDKNLVDSLVRDLQRALIEADVSIPLVKQLTDKIKQAALDERIKGIEKKEHLINYSCQTRKLFFKTGQQSCISRS